MSNDFIIKLSNKKTLILEIKGQKTDQSEAKRLALEDWVKAVTLIGEYGTWSSDIAYKISDIDNIITTWLNEI